MSLNWREIDLVLEELDLPGSHIQQIIQPDFKTLMLQIYRPGDRFWLRVCLETGRTRLHRTRYGEKKPKTRQRFAQHLHSRIKGGRITAAEQVGTDRIVRIEVYTGDVATVLWIRLWGGAANVLATDSEGRILDAFYRRPKRDEVTGAVITLPKPRTSAEASATRDERFQSRFIVPDVDGDPGISEQIDELYAAAGEEREAETLRERLRRTFESRLTRLKEQLDRAESRLDESLNADRLQLCGDLIRSNVHQMSRGDAWLDAEDYTDNGKTVSIELDVNLSPVENAQHYYDRARRAKRRRASLSEEKRNLENRVSGAAELLKTIDDAPLELLRQLDKEENQDPRENRSVGPKHPGLVFHSGAFTILVGRNARENDELLRRQVRGNDLWLHTRDYPGGYVFVRAQKNKSVPLEVLLDAGNLAVHFSKARPSGRAELYYTQVKHLRRAKGGPTGLVLPTHEKNLTITIDQSRLDRLRA